MNIWRVIFTDSESASGVAPACPAANTAGGEHDLGNGSFDEYGVYDCCPEPHIECWGDKAAERIAQELTKAEAELCS
jgi:hypothetical protein